MIKRSVVYNDGLFLFAGSCAIADKAIVGKDVWVSAR